MMTVFRMTTDAKWWQFISHNSLGKGQFEREKSSNPTPTSLLTRNILLTLNNQCLVWGSLFQYYDHVTMYSSIDSSMYVINDEHDILETRSEAVLNIRRY